MKRLLLVVSFILVGAVAAYVGFAAAVARNNSIWGPVLLEHAGVAIPVMNSPQLVGSEEQKAVRLDVIASLIQIALVRPKVEGLTASALEGLCQLSRAVELDSLDLNNGEPVYAHAIAYMLALAPDLRARLSKEDPLFLRPGCREVQLGIQPDVPASGRSSG